MESATRASLKLVFVTAQTHFYLPAVVNFYCVNRRKAENIASMYSNVSDSAKQIYQGYLLTRSSFVEYSRIHLEQLSQYETSSFQDSFSSKLPEGICRFAILLKLHLLFSMTEFDFYPLRNLNQLQCTARREQLETKLSPMASVQQEQRHLNDNFLLDTVVFFTINVSV